MVVNGEVVMRKSWIVAGALAGATLFAAPALAQRAADGAGFEVTPYVGYLFGEDIVSGPFGTSLGTGNGAIYGGQLSIPLMPGISLVGNVGYSSGQLRAGIPILGGFRFGESSTWVYDGSLELAVPVGAGVSSVQPFLQIGVRDPPGALHRRRGHHCDERRLPCGPWVGLRAPPQPRPPAARPGLRRQVRLQGSGVPGLRRRAHAQRGAERGIEAGLVGGREGVAAPVGAAARRP